MKLHIFDYVGAVEHEPQELTYAIRIGAPRDIPDPLKPSSLYLCVAQYSFDDTNPGRVERGQILFDEGIASRMIKGFREYQEKCQSLIVHCSAGRNRSPAVAMALNDLFNLGYDTEELMDEYPEYNSYIYALLKQVGKRELVKEVKTA